MPEIIKGLTLYRPWGWAVRELDKRIENRSKPCYLPVGSYIAIHNGKKWDPDGEALLKRLNPSGLMENPVNDLADAGQIVCVAKYMGTVEESDSEWFFGPYGWILADIVPIDGITGIKGSQGLWNLAPDVLAQLRIEYQKNSAERFYRG